VFFSIHCDKTHTYTEINTVALTLSRFVKVELFMRLKSSPFRFATYLSPDLQFFFIIMYSNYHLYVNIVIVLKTAMSRTVEPVSIFLSTLSYLWVLGGFLSKIYRILFEIVTILSYKNIFYLLTVPLPGT
jgi:hypothetical protein